MRIDSILSIIFNKFPCILLLDSLNRLTVDTIIRFHGYPGRKMVGDSYNDVCLEVIHHSNLNYMEKYFNAILDAIRINEVGSSLAILFLDRYHAFKFHKNLFGTHTIITDEITKKKVQVTQYSEEEKNEIF